MEVRPPHPAISLTVKSETAPRDAPDFRSPEPVAELLASLGFWVECRRTIPPTAYQYAFRGPYEGGRIEGEDLLAFAQLCHIWADRYLGEGVGKGPDRTGYKLGPAAELTA